MNLKQMFALGACLGGLAVAAPALAQEASDPAPEADATAQAEAEFSDTEVRQFASAALAVQQIRADTATAEEEKQPKLADAVQQSGLTPQRFNEIAEASRNDTELAQRIQLAANAEQETAAAARSVE